MKGKNKKLKSLLFEEKFDSILVSSIPNIIYLTNYDGFSYFEREAFLIINSKENFLITDGRYSEAVSKIEGFKLIEISSTNTLENIFKKFSKKLPTLGIEENDISVKEQKLLKKYFKLKNSTIIENLRLIKTKSEIKKIEAACSLGDKTFAYILKKIKKSISEKELAFEIENFIKSKGADISFPPIVAFGKNSSVPHHKTGDTKLFQNQIVLLDFGARFDNYCSDMTRTVFFGKADSKFKKIYNTVLKSQEKAIGKLDMIKDTQVIDKSARDYVLKQGYPTIPHSLGHGVGIEVHESPRLSPNSKEVLKSGMVFSVEPGIYIPGYGGVRIEDLLFLRGKSPRLLTHSSRKLIELN